MFSAQVDETLGQERCRGDQDKRKGYLNRHKGASCNLSSPSQLASGCQQPTWIASSRLPCRQDPKEDCRADGQTAGYEKDRHVGAYRELLSLVRIQEETQKGGASKPGRHSAKGRARQGYR